MSEEKLNYNPSQDPDRHPQSEIAEIFKDISNKLLDVSSDPEIIGEPNWDLVDDSKAPLTRAWLNMSEEDSVVKRLNQKLDSAYNNEYDRTSRYTRLGKAAKFSEAKGALSIYADEGLSQDSKGKIFNIYCSDKEIIDIVNELHARVGLEDGTKPWSQIFNMCLFGDDFWELVISKNKRMIHGLKFIPRELLIRVEKNNILQHFKVNSNFGQTNNQYYELISTSFKNKEQVIEPFRILHWKIDSTTYYPYGESVLDSVLPVIEELMMMEKALIIARIMRAPERRIYNVNVGNAVGNDAIKYAKEIVNGLKKKRTLDFFNSNRLEEQNDFMSGVEDLVIPRRATEEPNTVDTLPQLNLQEPSDIEFIRDRLFPGIQVPRQYLFDDTFANANSNLSNKSIRFAKFIRRIQKFYLYNIYKMAIVELRLRGINKERYKDLVITMNNPSNLDELQKLDLENQRWTITSQIKSMSTDPTKPFYSDFDIYRNIFDKSNDEILEIMKNSKIQGKGLNPFLFVDEKDRPEGYEIIDQISKLQGEQPPAAEGGGGETGGEQIPGAVGAALGAPEETNPGAGETPAETNQTPPAETGGEAPAEVVPATNPPGKEVTTAGEEIDIDGKISYNESKIDLLKKKAAKLKENYKKNKQEFNEDLIIPDKEEFNTKYTKINSSIDYFENNGEFDGIE